MMSDITTRDAAATINHIASGRWSIPVCGIYWFGGAYILCFGLLVFGLCFFVLKFEISDLESNDRIRSTFDMQGIHKPNVSRLGSHDHRMSPFAGAKEPDSF